MSDPKNLGNLKTRAKHVDTLAYLQKHRGKPQFRPAPSAGRAVNKVLRPLSRKFGPGVSSLRNHWPHIIGDRWAALSKPTALRGSKGVKTLYIEAKGPAAAILQADSNRILDKVNQFLGSGTITKIVVKQGRIKVIPKQVCEADTDLHETLEKTDNNSLQTALDRLNLKIKTRKQ